MMRWNEKNNGKYLVWPKSHSSTTFWWISHNVQWEKSQNTQCLVAGQFTMGCLLRMLSAYFKRRLRFVNAIIPKRSGFVCDNNVVWMHCLCNGCSGSLDTDMQNPQQLSSVEIPLVSLSRIKSKLLRRNQAGRDCVHSVCDHLCSKTGVFDKR